MILCFHFSKVIWRRLGATRKGFQRRYKGGKTYKDGYKWGSMSKDSARNWTVQGTEKRLVAKAQRSRNVVQGRFGGRGAGVGSDPHFEKMSWTSVWRTESKGLWLLNMGRSRWEANPSFLTKMMINWSQACQWRTRKVIHLKNIWKVKELINLVRQLAGTRHCSKPSTAALSEAVVTSCSWL